MNPNDAFDLLAATDLEAIYDDSNDLKAENFLVENIYEFSVTFLIEVTANNVTHTVRAMMSPEKLTELRLKGSKISYTGGLEFPADSGITKAQVESGRIVGVDIGITVLSDQGLTLAQRTGIARADLIKKYGYHYSKSITTPRP